VSSFREKIHGILHGAFQNCALIKSKTAENVGVRVLVRNSLVLHQSTNRPRAVRFNDLQDSGFSFGTGHRERTGSSVKAL